MKYKDKDKEIVISSLKILLSDRPIYIAINGHHGYLRIKAFIIDQNELIEITDKIAFILERRLSKKGILFKISHLRVWEIQNFIISSISKVIFGNLESLNYKLI